MVKVPQYQPDVALRPMFRQGIDVQATPDAAGAAIGKGMTALAAGMGHMADSFARVQVLEDTMRAKDADNQFAEWMRNRQYGEGGYLTLEGRNAIEGREAFEREAAEKRREFGKGLTPGAADKYEVASQARLQSSYQQSIVHAANARKKWFNDTSAARADGFANDALVAYNDPDKVQKSIAAGLLEIRERGAMLGWDAAVLAKQERDYASTTLSNVALRMAQDDPLKAEKFIKDNEKNIDGASLFSLRAKMETALVNAKADRNVADIIGSAPAQKFEPVATKQAPAAPGGGGGAIRLDDVMKSTTGLSETRDTAAISDFIRRSAGFNIDPSVTPWCAAFVNAVLGAHGIKGTGSLAARSFLNFGMPTDKPQRGDVVVLSRDGDPNKGHVGFFHGFDENGNVLVFGGNQSDGVNVTAFGRDRVLGFRTPGTVTAQTVALPNYTPQGLMAIQQRLDAITDPKERAATQTRLNSYLTAQNKIQEARQEEMLSWLGTQIVQNPALDLTKLPLDVQAALGPSKMTTLMNYQEKLRTSGEPVTDDRTMFELQTRYADDPVAFGKMSANELFQYRDKLSNADWKRVNDWRQTARTDQRKAREDGLNLTAAFSQATAQLEAVGITTTGKKGATRDEASKRIAQFQGALASQMDEFKRANEGRAPTQMEVQAMINRLLLPVVIKKPGMLWGTNSRDGFVFEAARRSDAETVDVAVKYEDIPVDIRGAIAVDLERKLGRKPSQREVEDHYEDFVLGRPTMENWSYD